MTLIRQRVVAGWSKSLLGGIWSCRNAVPRLKFNCSSLSTLNNLNGPSQAKMSLRICAAICAVGSSCACAKYHPGLCSPFIHSIVANESISGLWRPWSDCADAQSDQGLHCPLMSWRHFFANTFWILIYKKSLPQPFVFLNKSFWKSAHDPKAHFRLVGLPYSDRQTGQANSVAVHQTIFNAVFPFRHYVLKIS